MLIKKNRQLGARKNPITDFDFLSLAYKNLKMAQCLATLVTALNDVAYLTF